MKVETREIIFSGISTLNMTSCTERTNGKKEDLNFTDTMNFDFAENALNIKLTVVITFDGETFNPIKLVVRIKNIDFNLSMIVVETDIFNGFEVGNISIGNRSIDILEGIDNNTKYLVENVFKSLVNDENKKFCQVIKQYLDDFGPKIEKIFNE